MNLPGPPERTPTWQSAIGAVVVLALLACLALIGAGGWPWFKGILESAAPAWIQAIGSIAAIMAASAIAGQQVRSAAELEAKKKADAETQKLKIVMALMVRAHGLSNDICRAFETKEFSDFDEVSPELMLDTHLSLMALPVFEIPDGLLALDVLSIGRSLATIREHWLQLRVDVRANPSALLEGIARLETLARDIGSVSVDAVKTCKKAIAKRSAGLRTD